MTNSVFVYTDDGQVNLQAVAKITVNRVGKFMLERLDGGFLGSTGKDPSSTIVQLIPPSEAYECLTIWYPDGSLEHLNAQPVIAWALLCDGTVSPIAMGDTGVPGGQYGLRKVGSKEVVLPGDSTYRSSEEWLSDLRRHHSQTETSRSEVKDVG